MAKPSWFTAVGDFRSYNQGGQRADGPVSGTIRFTPLILDGDVIRAMTAEPRPAGVALVPTSGVIDKDGSIRSKPKRGNEDAPDGIPLVADSPFLELSTTLCYRVDFHNIRFGCRPGSIESFVFEAPKVDGAVVNIITALKVPGQTAIGCCTGSGGAQYLYELKDVTTIGYALGTADTDKAARDAIGAIGLDELQDLIDGGICGGGSGGGATTLAQLTDVTQVGLAVGTAADKPTARAAIDALSPEDLPPYLAGLTGDKGEPGTLWWFGEGPPGNIQGSRPGDVYVDTITGNLYKLGD